MGKTIDTSELMYRMGKYAEIDAGKEQNDMYKHFMLLLTRTIEKLPNVSKTNLNPIDDEIRNNQYKMTDAISLETGKTRTDKWFSEWVGMIMQIRRLELDHSSNFTYVKDKEGNLCPGAMHTSYVTDYYISEDKKSIVIQTEHTIYKFEKVEEN